MLNRRRFLRGLVAAPAVVVAHNLMPVRSLLLPDNDCIIMTDGGREPAIIMGFYKGQHGIWIHGNLLVNGNITTRKIGTRTIEAIAKSHV